MQGFSRAYAWNNGDLTVCGMILHNYLEANAETPWADVRYLFGEVMYGGHITDPWDRRITSTYLEVLLNPDLVNDSAYNDGWVILLEPHELQLNPDDKQLLENLMEHDEYVEYLAEL